jgi:hypothetical protein
MMANLLMFLTAAFLTVPDFVRKRSFSCCQEQSESLVFIHLNDVVILYLFFHREDVNGQRHQVILQFTIIFFLTSSDAKTLGGASSLIASSPSHQQQQQTGGSGKLLDQDKFSCQNRFVALCIEATSQGVATGGSGRVKRTAEHIISENHYQAHLQSLF